MQPVIYLQIFYKAHNLRIIIFYFMEYQRKKKQILSTVEYSNLLSFALVENKLEKNFKSIVQALLLTQSEGNQFKDDLQSLAKSSTRQLGALHDRVAQLEKKMSQMQKNQQKEASKLSMKKFTDSEEGSFDKRSHPPLSSPKLNVNFIESPANTQQHIPSTNDLKNDQTKQQTPFVQEGQIYQNSQNNQNNNKANQQLQRNYQELKDKLNKLLSEQVNAADLDKKLSSMKDSINLLKAQVKVMSDRESKSNRRISMNMGDKNQLVPVAISNAGSQEEGKDAQAMNALHGIQDELQRQINSLHIEINSMKLSIEELKQSNGESKRKQNKAHIQIDELMKNQKKLDERLQNSNENFENQMKEVKMDILNLQTKPQSQNDPNGLKKSRKIIDIKENVSPNANNQINDRISKLQAAIQGLVTESQYKRFKTEMKDKLSSLESEDENIRKQLKQEVQMLTQILDNKQLQLTGMQREIDDLKSKINDMTSQCQRKNNIAVSRCQQLKKNLQNLREDLQFYKSMNQTSSQNKFVIQPVGEASTDEDKKVKTQQSCKNEDDLKKYLNRKLHDQRTYLLGLIRDLQKKSGNKNNYEQDLVNVWDKLAEVNLFLNKKANQDDIKKSMAYYEKKLANLYQKLTSNDQNNEDARVARTNWFCLSCDKSLDNYKGKVNQHVVWDSMPIKPGYTKYYNKEDKKSLPTLKR